MAVANLAVSLGGLDISISVTIDEGRKVVHISVSDPTAEVVTESLTSSSTPLHGPREEAESQSAVPDASSDSPVSPSSTPLPPPTESPDSEPPYIVLALADRLSSGVGESPRSRVVRCWHLGRDDALSAAAAREGRCRPLSPALDSRPGAKYIFFVIYSAREARVTLAPNGSSPISYWAQTVGPTRSQCIDGFLPSLRAAPTGTEPALDFRGGRHGHWVVGRHSLCCGLR